MQHNDLKGDSNNRLYKQDNFSVIKDNFCRDLHIENINLVCYHNNNHQRYKVCKFKHRNFRVNSYKISTAR